MKSLIFISFLFFFFICINAQGKGTTTNSCSGTAKDVNLATGSYKTISIVTPLTSTLVVQATPGSSWAAKLYGDSSKLSAITILSASAPSNGELKITVTDTSAKTTNDGNNLMNPFRLLIFVVFFSFLSMTKMGAKKVAVISVIAMIGATYAVPSVLYYCARGTLVITYPQGGRVKVNENYIPTCSPATSNTTAVQQPVMYSTKSPVQFLNTFWYASPVIRDLDQDGSTSELVVCSYGCFVFDSSLTQLQKISITDRVYAPHSVVDIDNNGKLDLCFGAGTSIYCYEWSTSSKSFTSKSGFPKSIKGSAYPEITSGEIRGFAVADIDMDGYMELIASTTNSAIQYYVLDYKGNYKSGWPRYNTATGVTNDADPANNNFNGINSFGHYRYGTYGLNVGVGNMDDDVNLEIIGTYDNHQIQAFKYNGVGINMDATYKNPRSPSKGKALTWGQATPRWTNLTTDNYLYVSGAPGCYPNPLPSGNPCVTGGDPWLQFTDSPASIMDIDNDGSSEIVVVPNNEKGSCCNGGGYVSLNRALFVLNGAYGNSGNASFQAVGSGLRKTGFDTTFPPLGSTITCQSCFDSTGSCGGANGCRKNTFYPPSTVPSISFGDLSNSGKLTIVSSFSDGTVRAFSSSGAQVWLFNYAGDLAINNQNEAIESSEAIIADLNGDGTPEVLFNVYGIPSNPMSSNNNQFLYILNNSGSLLYKLALNTAALAGNGNANGNGNGACGAPAVGDLNNDGSLEIVSHTFDGRMIVWTVPGSSTNCLLWPTGRGGWMRKGQPDYNYAA